MSEELSTSFEVAGCTCTMSCPQSAFAPGRTSIWNVDWTPDVPKKLSKKDLKVYRKNRDAFLLRVSKALGIGPILVVG